MGNFWKMCLNPKVIGGVVAVAVGVLLFAPHLAASALPVLFIAICPLSMLLMMRSMQGDHSGMREERTPNSTDPVSTNQVADLKGEVAKLHEREADLEQQIARLERSTADQGNVRGGR